MNNSFGNLLKISLYGESHGPEMGIVIDGLSPGMRIDPSFIRKRLYLRSAHNKISTDRRESDNFRIVSGALENKGFYISSGGPLCIVIENKEARSEDYKDIASIARPGHADYTANIKYKGFQDKRGGGRFSGRLTAPLVAGGAILMEALQKKGVNIFSHILRLKDSRDLSFNDLSEDKIKIERLRLLSSDFPLLDPEKEGEFKNEILKARQAGDSIGGHIETMVTGLPVGLGEPFFNSLESCLAHAIFSIPAIKGISFGLGFSFADLPASLANDSPYIEGGHVSFRTNNNAGINGGISNGMPLLFTSVIKPPPSISLKQQSLNFDRMENWPIQIKGRHDPCIVNRAIEVVNAMTAICLADFMLMEFGRDFFQEVERKKEE